MYLSKITIENFRCFGDGLNRFELTLRPGLTALVEVKRGHSTFFPRLVGFSGVAA